MLRDDGRFHSSSFCTSGGCVAVSLDDEAVVVAHQVDLERHPLRFTRDEWAAFVAGVKAGEFDLDQP